MDDPITGDPRVQEALGVYLSELALYELALSLGAFEEEARERTVQAMWSYVRAIMSATRANARKKEVRSA